MHTLSKQFLIVELQSRTCAEKYKKHFLDNSNVGYCSSHEASKSISRAPSKQRSHIHGAAASDDAE